MIGRPPFPRETVPRSHIDHSEYEYQVYPGPHTAAGGATRPTAVPTAGASPAGKTAEGVKGQWPLMQSDLKGRWSLIKGQWSLDSQTPRTNGPKASKPEEKHRARVLHQDAASAPSRRGVEQILATAARWSSKPPKTANSMFRHDETLFRGCSELAGVVRTGVNKREPSSGAGGWNRPYKITL